MCIFMYLGVDARKPRREYHCHSLQARRRQIQDGDRLVHTQLLSSTQGLFGLVACRPVAKRSQRMYDTHTRFSVVVQVRQTLVFKNHCWDPDASILLQSQYVSDQLVSGLGCCLSLCWTV